MKKNFDEIKVGSWYKQKNGNLIRLLDGHNYNNKGLWCSIEDCGFELVLEIEEPILVPVKRKVKKDLVAFANVYGDVIFLYNTEREAKAARTNGLGKETAQAVVKLTGTYELEE